MDFPFEEALKVWHSTNVRATIRSPPVTSPTPSSLLRRTNKPLTEKRRRARINHSLGELKTILISNSKDETAPGKPLYKNNKLEKADILEMTVRYLHMLHSFESREVDIYEAGFIACIKEVDRYMSLPDRTITFTEFIQRDFKFNLIHYLEACLLEIQSRKKLQNVKTTSTNTNNRNDTNQKALPTKGPITNGTKSKSTALNVTYAKESPGCQTEPLDYSIKKMKIVTPNVVMKTNTKLNDRFQYVTDLNPLNSIPSTSRDNVHFLMPPPKPVEPRNYVFPISKVKGKSLKRGRKESNVGKMVNNNKNPKGKNPPNSKKDNNDDPMWRPW